jgi:glycerol-3-phosphate acyltransferase PlsX
MGGDHAPANVVYGAARALREHGGKLTVVLVGKADRIEEELRTLGGKIEGCRVVHAPDVITMEDSPTAALRAKKNSSIAVGLDLHRCGKADAFVSAGNTGAVLSASTLILGRLQGVGRPTIGALIPTERSPCLLLDAGANVDCRPRHLLEFGVMGSIYMHVVLGIPSPKVALLNVGEEENKGNDVSVEAWKLLKQAPINFIGNAEGRDILCGAADVVVCDGFAGNILLKFGESIPRFLKARFKAFAARSPLNSMIGIVARRGLRGVLKELDYQEHGGVPVLGVNGVSVIGHGGSTALAFENMILRAAELVQKRVHVQIQERLAGIHV